MTLKTKLLRMTAALAVVVGAALVLGVPNQSKAEYPTKPITLMVGFSAGGGTDVYARGLASFIHEHLGQPMIVVNKPGAAGMIAARAVKGMPSDGYTLYIINAGTFIAKAMMDGEKAAVHPLRDMQPLGAVGQFVTSLLVPADSPFKSAKELIAHAKANPGKLRWSHPGRGTTNMMAGALFLQETGITAQDVPFKNAALARNAVAGNQVDFAFVGIHNMAGFESKVRAFGVTNNERDKLFKDVPTFDEQGLPQLGIAGPVAVFGNKDLPADVVAKVKDAVKKVATSKGYVNLLKKAGAVGFHRSAEDVLKQVDSMAKKFAPVVAELRKAKKGK
ncbi:MAG: tripartite tricarboxylate transporter substrate binding protein [Rhodospirillales bacterium]|nr:tripartite tricarboxylate transporter substrate binding protein [Rhodospirillales bacterium]